MVSRARVDQGSTTTGIGVSSVYKKHRFLRSRAQPSVRRKIELAEYYGISKTSSSSNIKYRPLCISTLWSVVLEMWCSSFYRN